MRRIGRGGHNHEGEAVRPSRAEDGDRGGGGRSPDGKEGQGGVAGSPVSRAPTDLVQLGMVAKCGGREGRRNASREGCRQVEPPQELRHRHGLDAVAGAGGVRRWHGSGGEKGREKKV
jgi:hypothetical protein